MLSPHGYSERRLRSELEPEWLEYEPQWQNEQDREWEVKKFETLGQNYFQCEQWLGFVEAFDIRIEVSAKGKVLLSAKVGKKALSIQEYSRPNSKCNRSEGTSPLSGK